MSKKRNKAKLKFNFDEVKTFFPCIKKIYSGLKDVRMFEAYLITDEDKESKLIYTKDEIISNSFHVIAVVNLRYYSSIGAVIYDRDKFIDWNKIEVEKRHCNFSKLDTYLGNELCTHIPEQAKDMENPLLENLKTAYAMYVAYNKLLNGKPFVLNGYSHGEEGRKEYEREKRNKQ